MPAPTAKKGKKKEKINALSVDGRVLWYGGWTKEGKKYQDIFIHPQNWLFCWKVPVSRESLLISLMWGDIDGYDTCYKMLAIGGSHTVGG